MDLDSGRRSQWLGIGRSQPDDSLLGTVRDETFLFEFVEEREAVFGVTPAKAAARNSTRATPPETRCDRARKFEMCRLAPTLRED